MTVNSTTGTGKLILDVSASNPNVGVNGVETFAVQFINANHALITQFDGSATSSGGFDLQTASSSAGGNFAFTLSGLDTTNEATVAYGGVFSNTSGTIHGTCDEKDFGKVLAGNPLTATDDGVGADVYGRGSISGFTDPNNGDAPISLVYYIVGPEVLRIIDVDFVDALVGSAYGQGSATSFDSTVLSRDVFGILDNTANAYFAAAGQLVAADTGVGTFSATFTGEADDDEGGAVMATGTPGGVAGNYSFSNTVLGYGSMTGITGLGSMHTLGLYATDPTLNLLDPNNTTAANLGAALVLDLDANFLAQGTGIVVPQGSIASDGSDLTTAMVSGRRPTCPAKAPGPPGTRAGSSTSSGKEHLRRSFSRPGAAGPPLRRISAIRSRTSYRARRVSTLPFRSRGLRPRLMPRGDTPSGRPFHLPSVPSGALTVQLSTSPWSCTKLVRGWCS